MNTNSQIYSTGSSGASTLDFTTFGGSGLHIASGGAVSFDNNATVGSTLVVSGSSASTSASTGAIQVTTGGIGVGGNSFFGGNLSIAGITTHTGSTASTSNTTGNITSSGGIGISNATNATSTTNGGSITTAGGLAVAKDTYIGGNLIVSGTLTSGVSAPGTRTTGSLINTVSLSVNNQLLITNGTNNIYTATFSCTPTSANAVTSFVTNLPNRTSNSTNVYEIIATIQGFSNSTSLTNCVCFAVTGSVNFKIQFTSIDNTNVHYIQIHASYSSN